MKECALWGACCGGGGGGGGAQDHNFCTNNQLYSNLMNHTHPGRHSLQSPDGLGKSVPVLLRGEGGVNGLLPVKDLHRVRPVLRVCTLLHRHRVQLEVGLEGEREMDKSMAG